MNVSKQQAWKSTIIYVVTNLATRRRKEHQECHLDEFKYISELPTLKTANLTLFLLAASTRLQNYQRIRNFTVKLNDLKS
ncbi:hypothetical protein RMCBS344292_08104 [Rhizopus microsporus]|nr:hypothetical protein RMCBS344292_08104 [Rhizopus microsporus]